MKIKVYLILLSVFSFISLPAQDPIPIWLGFESEIPFINSKGETVFSLPLGTRTEVKYHPIASQFNDIGNGGSLNPFLNGELLVKSKDNEYYLLNNKGEKVHSFGKKYKYLHRFSKDRFIGVNSYNHNAKSYIINRAGENVFGENYYAQIQPFSEGFAAVKTGSGRSAWAYIDTTGNLALIVNNLELGVMPSAGYPFSEGIARMELKERRSFNKRGYIFIDENGKTLLNLEELFPDRKFGLVSDYKSGLIMVPLYSGGRTYDFIFIDKKGKKQFEFKKALQCKFSKSGNGYVKLAIDKSEDKSKQWLFFNKKGKTINLPLPKGQALKSISDWGNYYFKLEVIENGHHKYAIHRSNDLKQLYLTEYPIARFNKEYVVTYDKQTGRMMVENIMGQLIWETPFSEVKFDDIQKAIAQKDQVRHFKVDDIKDLEEGLFDLINLEYLTIKFIDLKELPSEFKRFEKLKSLKLFGLNKINELPSFINDFKSLEYFEISSYNDNVLPSIKKILEEAPALKKAVIEDQKKDRQYLLELRRKRPNLKVIWHVNEMQLAPGN